MTDMPTMRAAFRTTLSGDGKYEMIFRFPTMEALHKADDEWCAALRASTDAAAVGGVAVRLGPCQHRWSHAPTVGYYQCIDCGERHDHGTPIYEQLKQMPAHPPADAAAVAGEDVAANEGRRRLFMRALAGLNLNENPVTVLGYAMAMGDQEDCYLADYIEDAPKYIDHLSDLGYRITRTDEASTDGERQS